VMFFAVRKRLIFAPILISIVIASIS